MTSVIETEVAADEVLGGLSIIDCDAHFTEPPDLWTSRAPGSIKSQVPIMRTTDGITAWYLDDVPLCSIGGNTLRTGNRKQLGTQCIQPWDDVDVSTWKVDA